MEFKRVVKSKIDLNKDFAIVLFSEGGTTMARVHSPEHGWKPEAVPAQVAIDTARQQGSMPYNFVVVDDEQDLWEGQWGRLIDWPERLIVLVAKR